MKTITRFFIFSIVIMGILMVITSSCGEDSEENPTPLTVAIGDTYAGGIVFYVTESRSERGTTVYHGLCAAPTDQHTQGTYGVHWDEAVSLCNDLSAGGYNDWYLPNKENLKLMYDELYANSYSYGFESGRYWSSTEFDSGSAYQIHFNTVYEGRESTTNKNDGWGFVRAIREF